MKCEDPAVTRLRKKWLAERVLQTTILPIQSAPADRWKQIVRTVQAAKVFLPIEKAKVDIRGDIAAVRLDSCNDGRPLVLLLDRKFWERTLSKIKGGLLHVDGGKVYVRYPHKLKESVDHWLPNLIAAVCTDYLSVRARTADTIDYRKQNLEIRRTEDQKADHKRLEESVTFQTENPDYDMQIGGKRVALGGTTEETIAGVTAKLAPVVGIFRKGEQPKVTKFGRRVRDAHDQRQGVNSGHYDQLATLTKALVAVPTGATDSGIGQKHI